MARPIVLSNGTMLVGLNKFGLVHDFYYPHVGGENHAAAQSLRHRIGVWTDGSFSWLDDGSWTFTFDYLDHALIGVTTARHDGFGILLEFTDAVDATLAAFMRSVHVVNTRPEQRSIRLFFHQAFDISNSRLADTAQVIPHEKTILHYKGQRYFMVGARSRDGESFTRYAVGSYGIDGHEGSFRDAEDGELSGNTVEHGAVDSVIGFDITLPAHDSSRLSYWITAGERFEEARETHHILQRDGVLHHLLKTDEWWQKWLSRTQLAANKIPKRFRQSFVKSTMLVKAHIDVSGAVIASTDTTMLNYSRDSYAYSWPRDAAYSLWPLLRLGYTQELTNFFDFCSRTVHKDGYLMHKYLPDGSVGSSWHPYVHGTHEAPPIQHDETAIVVFLFARYYAIHPSTKLLERYYPSIIKPMADYLASTVDQKTGIPSPSYDLWERIYESTTYTTAVIYGALAEAAHIAEKFHKTKDAVIWRSAADAIKQQAGQWYDEQQQCFIKGFYTDDDGNRATDTTIDISSVYGAYIFGLFELDDKRITSSIASCTAALRAHEGVPAFARFVNDEYNRHNPAHVGNPWYIATLWLAQYACEVDHDSCMEMIEWTQRQMTNSGVLAEQCDPQSFAFVSVAPLTWSQAEFVNCLLDTIPQD